VDLKDILGKAAVDKLVEDFGEGAIQLAAEARAENMPRWSSGSLRLDISLGGGWTIGRFHTIFGPPSSAKTATTLKGIAMAQKCCSSCFVPLEVCVCGKQKPSVTALISTENDFEKRWARTLGVDVDALVFCEPTHGEMGLDVAEALIRSGSLDLLVIDSLALLVPTTVIEESSGKDHMAVQARLLSKGTQKIAMAFRGCYAEFGRYPTVLVTNHTRVDPSVMFGSPEVKPGGSMPQYAACTETRFSPVGYEPKKGAGANEPDCAVVKFRVHKNKTFDPRRAGEFRLLFKNSKDLCRGDFDDGGWPVDRLKEFGLLKQSKKKGKPWVLAGEEFRIQKDATKQMQQDLPFWWKVREVLATVMCRP